MHCIPDNAMTICTPVPMSAYDDIMPFHAHFGGLR